MGHRNREHSTRDIRRKRDQDGSRSPQRDRDRDRNSYSSSRSTKSTSTKEEKKREQETKRGIETARNRLKASLNVAINEFSSREPTTSSNGGHSSKIEKEYSATDFVDSVARQAAIDRIEEAGFVPSTFSSNAKSKSLPIGAGSSNKKKAEGQKTALEHDRAMFGPMWASKEIEKKQQANKAATKGSESRRTTPIGEPTTARLEMSNKNLLAHENLREDYAVRQQRWLNLWRERRKMAFEGSEIR